MLGNYIKTALRNIARNKLYSVINIIGLAMGLTIFIFGGVFADYEYSHDAFFENSQRIYTVGVSIKPEANAGINEMNAVPSAVLPFIKAELPEIESSARTVVKEILFSVGEDSYYQTLRFADPELLTIFDFDYIVGDSSALSNSTGMVITESTAFKYFGDENPIGRTITLDHKNDLTVTAVIHDLPPNTHFGSYFIEKAPFDVIVSMAAMERITDIQPDTDWEEMHPTNLTYLLLPENLDQNWLEEELDGIYERHFGDEYKQFVSDVFSKPIIDANLSYWQLIGLPIIETVEILGLLVLIIACVNYTNLATAQSMKRTREVGLRKVLGAGKVQLLLQFIIESTTITLIAMVFSISLLEFLLPLLNMVTGKALALSYQATLPWLLTTTIAVGILSGCYPAYVISKINPIETLRDTGLNGRSSIWVRGIMIGVQFTISVFMLALVLVVISQNERVERSSNIFPKDQIYVLEGFDVEQIAERQELLRNEISSIVGVENFSLSSQVPYEGTQYLIPVSTIVNDFSSSFNINRLLIDRDFLDTYNMPLIVGRMLSGDVSRDSQNFSVIVNELAVKNLELVNPEGAIGKVFYGSDGANGISTFTIIGVIEDKNFLGLHNEIKPFVMLTVPDGYREASIKISTDADPQIVKSIEAAWKRVIPDYPMQGRFLTETFQDLFGIFELASKVLSAFALFAFVLALIGLFGLSAFMAEQRTKEIGIRKVHGATPPQVVNLLIWQFSKPVIWATPFALGLAYLASDMYLGFFDDRIGLPYGSLIFAGAIGLLLSWLTVATHAYNVARTNPINALHYE